jgi:hypothetical protein
MAVSTVKDCEVIFDMKQAIRRAGGGIAVLLGVMGTIGGCTDEETEFFILGNIHLESPECVARAEATESMLISGVLDVAIKPDYEATLLVGSQLAPRGDKANLRTETMITTITGAEVQLYTDAGALSTEFTVPASGVIRPESGADPGFGIITATLIPAATGLALADELSNPAEVRTRVAKVTVFGRTIGGLEVETSPFSYVIRVCEGCLVNFPASAFDPVFGCTGGSADDIEAPPCRTGQDDGFDCRICSGSNSFCAFPGGVAPPPE